MMIKTNTRGKVTAIYLNGIWYFPKPMTKKRKKSVYQPKEINVKVDFFNYEQVYAFQDNAPVEVMQKDDFELMIDKYVKKHRVTPCYHCRIGDCPYDWNQKACDTFKKMVAEV